jgi:hypothetical protein
MAEPAIRHMTLAEFLRWEDGTDTRYELLGRARGDEGDRWITELVRGRDAILHLSSVDFRIAMAELYEGIEIDAENAA